MLRAPDEASLCEAAERVRRAIAAIPPRVADDQILPASASFGVSMIANRGRAGIETAIRTADTALYRAKAQGRNRVCGTTDAPASVVVPLAKPGAA